MKKEKKEEIIKYIRDMKESYNANDAFVLTTAKFMAYTNKTLCEEISTILHSIYNIEY